MTDWLQGRSLMAVVEEKGAADKTNLLPDQSLYFDGSMVKHIFCSSVGEGFMPVLYPNYLYQVPEAYHFDVHWNALNAPVADHVTNVVAQATSIMEVALQEQTKALEARLVDWMTKNLAGIVEKGNADLLEKITAAGQHVASENQLRFEQSLRASEIDDEGGAYSGNDAEQKLLDSDAAVRAAAARALAQSDPERAKERLPEVIAMESNRGVKSVFEGVLRSVGA